MAHSPPSVRKGGKTCSRVIGEIVRATGSPSPLALFFSSVWSSSSPLSPCRRRSDSHKAGLLAPAAIRPGLNSAQHEGLNRRVRLIVNPPIGFHSAKAALALVTLSVRPTLEAGLTLTAGSQGTLTANLPPEQICAGQSVQIAEALHGVGKARLELALYAANRHRCMEVSIPVHLGW